LGLCLGLLGVCLGVLKGAGPLFYSNVIYIRYFECLV
jgi:hypothetical protein